MKLAFQLEDVKLESVEKFSSFFCSSSFSEVKLWKAQSFLVSHFSISFFHSTFLEFPRFCWQNFKLREIESPVCLSITPEWQVPGTWFFYFYIKSSWSNYTILICFSMRTFYCNLRNLYIYGLLINLALWPFHW